MSWAAGEHSHSHSHSHSSESSPRNGLKKKESTSSINQKRLSAGAELSRRGSSASLLSSDGAPNLGRRDSLASLQGSDGSSSRAPSALGLRSERPASATKEKAAEMERNWNKPRPRLSSANLRLHQSSSFQRSRTQSFPSRPDSAQSTQSIVSTQSSRSQVPSLKPRSQRRTSSITSSGRGSSIGSIDPDEEPEFEEVVLHERERNWNSPHPKWEISRRSISPAPPSRSTSPMPSPSPTHSRFSLNFRRRTESLGILKGTPPEEKTGGTASMKTPAKKPGLRTAASQSALSVSGHGPKSPSSPHLQAKAGSQSPSYLGLEPKRASHIPRPKSPMPSSQSRAKSNPELSNAGHRPTKLPTFKGAGFQFPSRSHSPLPPLELDEDSMDNSDHALNVNDENTRSDGEIDGSAEASHSPEESREPPAESNAARKRGHRRSLTEFSVAVGAIPPLPRVDSVAFPTDALRVPTDDVFTSDEESIPATSTPTIRVTPLPASDAPGASESNGERANDESGPPQRERGSLENPPATPPGTPPGTDEPYLSLVTPPRPQSFTPPRVETGAPSPTKDIPELPGPPSSSEEDTEDVQGYTPERPATIGNNINFSMMKTPKPPGAWAATPVPPRLPPSRAHSLPEAGEETETEQENGHATPVSSLSRAASLPTQTPAPPGAWMNTPGSRRKSILKVRFEVETSESEASHAGLGIGNGAPYGAPQFKLEDNSDESGLQHAREPAEHGPDGANALKSNEEQASEHPSFSLTPPSPQRTPRKGPSIRVLDAFGREAPNDEVAIKQEDDDEEVQVKEEATTSQRNRSSIRIVDAMGREILEEVESSADVSTLNGDSPLSQGQALARVRETIAELREGFIEAERSQNSLGIHDSRAEELQRVSRSARDARDKIFRSLQMVRSSDPELRSRLGPLKESMRNNRLLSGVLEDGRWRLPSPWTIACFITLQIVLIFIMYKVSVLRARRIFLTTYYDPFYPDLHLHLIKRDTLHHVSITTPTSWSIFSIPDGVQRVGWRGAFSEMWGNMTLGVTNLQQHVWRVWGAEDQPLSWPPT
ncbi:hypothetical protein GLOTRDRAFT_115203 [Gloeophyllum trabeum ATCC 11539]|uniref:Uncharacterized protein n=1 Tax=Gloeophyllum trabeum (strain ATCC 11539 / FP-39264 / Madison 617) TaxID=670483 RepID=S7QB57_GLOTA|nr:uncharacterized protein GLOTRDRAFT_115203 [Gloeophyllum trabeum ATCC 11539]EPQ57166.1 hypothetical protein GLOTRDRAFT_115203 [Gloeophyllum trabeum ATCC 11539]